MNSNRRTSRIAGFWYLLVAVFGLFNTMFVSPRLYVAGDAAATVANIQASEWLYRLGILSNLVTTVCFLLLANALYKLFKTVDEDLVRLMVIFVVASVPISYLETFKFAPILLVSGAGHLSAFEPAQLQALAMALLDLFNQGHYITFIYYGLWMFPLGMLVFKSGSGLVPRVLGPLLIVACFGYLATFFETLLSLDFQAITSMWMNIAYVAEISCIVWLLVKGPKDRDPASV